MQDIHLIWMSKAISNHISVFNVQILLFKKIQDVNHVELIKLLNI